MPAIKVSDAEILARLGNGQKVEQIWRETHVSKDRIRRLRDGGSVGRSDRVVSEEDWDGFKKFCQQVYEEPVESVGRSVEFNEADHVLIENAIVQAENSLREKLILYAKKRCRLVLSNGEMELLRKL